MSDFIGETVKQQQEGQSSKTFIDTTIPEGKQELVGIKDKIASNKIISEMSIDDVRAGRGIISHP